MIGKVPATKGADGFWTGTPGTLKGRSMTVEQAKQAHHDKATVGILGEFFGGFDVDSEYARAVTAVRTWVELCFDETAWRGRSNSEKKLGIYRNLEGGRKWAVQFKPPGWKQGDKIHKIEFLGNGQYWNAEGMHPSGVPYTWSDPHPLDRGLDNLPGVTSDGLELCRAGLPAVLEAVGCEVYRVTGSGGGGTRKPIGDPRSQAPDPELVLKVLAAVPCTAERFRDRNDLVPFLCGVKASLGVHHERYRAHVLEWWWQHPESTDEDYFDRIWDSIFETELDWQWLDKIAGTGLAPETDFVEHPEVEQVPPFQQMLADWVYIAAQHAFTNVNTYQILGPSAFDAMNTRVAPCGAHGPRSAHNLFLNHPAARKCETSVYQPGATMITDGKVNLWRPSKLVPIQGDASLWLNHMHELLPAMEQYEHALNWFAAVLRHVKVNHALVFVSLEQGIGKDTALAPLVAGLGDHNVKHVTPEMLCSTFTEYLLAELCIVPEMKNYHKGEVYNKLKSLIAVPPATVAVNIKNRSIFEIPKVQNWVMTTNTGNAVSLDPEDRRHWVGNCVGHPREDVLYYQRIWDWYTNSGGLQIVVGYLLTRDIINFNAFDPPMTEAKHDMIELAAPPAVKYLNRLFDHDGPFHNRDIICTFEIREMLSENWQSSLPSDIQIVEALQRRGYRKVPGSHRISGGTRNVWTRLNPTLLTQGDISVDARWQADRKKEKKS